MKQKSSIMPEYYKKFRCIAGACSFTCCQEWSIAGLDGKPILLKEDHFCPYLNEEKLCKQVIAQGEKGISRTCQEFPRQRNEFKNHVEYALSPCCPEVLDLLGQEAAFQIPRNEMEILKRQWKLTDLPFYGKIRLRENLIALLQRPEITLRYGLMIGFYLLLVVQEQGLISAKQEKQMEELFTESEILKVKEAIEKMEFSWENTFLERNELFLDLIENYQKKGMYEEYLSPMAELAERIAENRNVEKSDVAGSAQIFETGLIQEDQLFRNYMAAELYSGLLAEGSTLEDMILSYQWILLEYVLLRHGAFLHCTAEENQKESLRDSMVLLSRLMGYDGESVQEYLKDHFQTPQWEWGYGALIL